MGGEDIIASFTLKKNFCFWVWTEENSFCWYIWKEQKVTSELLTKRYWLSEIKGSNRYESIHQSWRWRYEFIYLKQSIDKSVFVKQSISAWVIIILSQYWVEFALNKLLLWYVIKVKEKKEIMQICYSNFFFDKICYNNFVFLTN